MSGLVLENITAGYGAGYGFREVVKDISFSVRAGEFCALLGRNGSGKTTLIKALCGLVPAAGRCLVDGVDCTALNEKGRARCISYTPQRHSKMQGVPVIDAVLMGYNPRLAFLSSPGNEEKKQAENILHQMGLGELSDHDFARLSEGQKQLVILARTLVQNTPVMLMDEPDSSLDFANRHIVMKKISGLVHSEKKAGLIALHDPNFAIAYCDTVVLINEGKVSGRLNLAEASGEEIRLELQAVYGEVELVEQNRRFLILPK